MQLFARQIHLIELSTHFSQQRSNTFAPSSNSCFEFKNFDSITYFIGGCIYNQELLATHNNL